MVRFLSSSSIRNCRGAFEARQCDSENNHVGLLGTGALGSLSKVTKAPCRVVRLFDVDILVYIAVKMSHLGNHLFDFKF